MGWFQRLRATFRPSTRQDIFDEEARFHLDRRIDENVGLGMDPEAACREAYRRFGNRELFQEYVNDVDTLTWLRDFGRDVCIGFRTIRHYPGFAFVAVATLALGIGATTSVFAFVGGVLLRPLPYAHPDELVRIVHNRPDKTHATLIKFTFLTALQRQHPAFAYVAGYDSYSNLGAKQLEATAITASGEVALAATRVSPELFPLLGEGARVGRTFSAMEADEAHNRVALLSYSAWRQYFGGDDHVLGRAITIDRNPFTIIGVMPPEFAFPDRATQCWIPLTPHEVPPASAPRADSPDSGVLEIVARLNDGVSRDVATSATEAIFRSVDADLGDHYQGIKQRAELVPLQEAMAAAVRPALRLFPIAVCFVLLIACVNVANLMLARTASKQRELAIRASLGAGRSRLIRQTFAESSALTSVAALAGALFAMGALHVISTLAPPDVPRVEELRLNLAVLLTAIVVSLVTAFAAGVGPALRIAATDYNLALRGGQPSTGPRIGRIHVGNVMVVAQVTLATVLLVAAGLMLRSVATLGHVRPGYDPDRVLAFQVVLPSDVYASDFYQTLLQRLKADPSVAFAGTTDKLPIVGVGGFFLSVQGLPIPASDDRMVMRVVSEDYLRAMGTRVLRGRGFANGDVAGAPLAMLVNETFVRHHFGQQDPIDAFVTQGTHQFQIVGVVEDIRHGGLDVTPDSEYFVDTRQSPVAVASRPYVVVRAANDPRSLASTVRTLVQQGDPRAFVDVDMTTMRELVSASIARPRFYSVLLMVFAGLAIALAAFGLYGVMSYTIARRTPEIGVRMALGASRAKVLTGVMREGAVLVGSGLMSGLALATGVTRFMQAMLFGVGALDPFTFVAVPALFIVVASLAIYGPARRATQVDPLTALRAQ